MNGSNVKKYAFLFPGAGMSNLHNILNADIDSVIKELLLDKARISKAVTGIDVGYYISSEVTAEDEELVDQIVLHMVNCSIAEFLPRRGASPSIICGYSMGIYSALVCGGAIRFESGLEMLHNAFHFMKFSLSDKSGAMAAIIGLNRKQLEQVIAQTSTTHPVEIANANGEYNLIITGIAEDVHAVMQAAEKDGAFKIIELKVSLPFHHSGFLSDAAERFLDYLGQVEILDLKVPLMSAIDQRIITGSSEVRFELHRNIKENMAWHKSIEMIASGGIADFVEVGMGNPLQKILKTMNKNYSVYTEKDFRGEAHERRQSV